jgi:hypothetical protein
VSTATSIGPSDAFLLRLNNSGEFISVETVGNDAYDWFANVVVDGNGQVFISALNGSTDNPRLNPIGRTVVMRLDNAGHIVPVAEFRGVSANISLGTSGEVVVTGWFEGTVDVDPGPNQLNQTSVGNIDAIVVKLDAAGSLRWAAAYGGPGDDLLIASAVDSTGNVFSSGFFEGTADFDPGPDALSLTSAGGFDIFVARLAEDASGDPVPTWPDVSTADVAQRGLFEGREFTRSRGFYSQINRLSPRPPFGSLDARRNSLQNIDEAFAEYSSSRSPKLAMIVDGVGGFVSDVSHVLTDETLDDELLGSFSAFEPALSMLN